MGCQSLCEGCHAKSCGSSANNDLAPLLTLAPRLPPGYPAAMRALLLAILTVVGCAPMRTVEGDRAQDMAEISVHAPAERAGLLRDRVLRDGLNAHAAVTSPTTKRDLWGMPVEPSAGEVATVLSARALAIADNYVALGETLAAAGDRDAALVTFEDALAVVAKLNRTVPEVVRIRVSALRGEASLWKDLGQRQRSQAASILGDAEQLAPGAAPGFSSAPFSGPKGRRFRGFRTRRRLPRHAPLGTPRAMCSLRVAMPSRTSLRGTWSCCARSPSAARRPDRGRACGPGATTTTTITSASTGARSRGTFCGRSDVTTTRPGSTRCVEGRCRGPPSAAGRSAHTEAHQRGRVPARAGAHSERGPVRYAPIVLFGLFAGGCATSHALPHPSQVPPAPAGCAIGVGPLMDNEGVDLALDLRDYLRAHGPCRTVVAVTSTDDENVDLVVSGRATAHLTPGGTPVSAVGARVLGVGLGVAIVGAIVYGVAASTNPTTDANGFVDPTSRKLQQQLKGIGSLSAESVERLAARVSDCSSWTVLWRSP